MDKITNESVHWHEQHESELSFGAKVADMVASGMGSWAFIIIQTIAVVTWVGWNIINGTTSFDPYGPKSMRPSPPFLIRPKAASFL